MTSFLTDAFKAAELARLLATDHPAHVQVAYVFAHDEALPDVRIEAPNNFSGSAVIIDGTTYYNGGVTENRPQPWFEPATCPSYHLVDWMFTNGLVHDVWLLREPDPHDIIRLGPTPQGHPAEQQVRAYLASGRPLPDISDGQGTFGRGVFVNEVHYSREDWNKSGPHFNAEECALFDLATWMIECRMASIWMG